MSVSCSKSDPLLCEQYAHDAAFSLLKNQPEASAGTHFLPPLRLWLPPVIFITGLSWFTPNLVANFALLAIYAYCFTLAYIRLSAALTPAQFAPRHTLKNHQLPQITVLVALYDEANVCDSLVKALAQIDYPADRLDIMFVLEHRDQKTIRMAHECAPQIGANVIIVPETEGPMTKPRALNYALKLTRCDIVVVYDAEDAPHPGQLISVAEAFAANERLGVVQAPLGWYNHSTNWLTGQFAVEYACQFEVLLPFYARLGLPLPLGGTSNAFRRSALNEVGCWDPFNVTEDADLGFRLARHGWQAGVIPVGTLEEAPERRKAWTGQRSRWLKGHLITWLVHMRDPRQLADQAGFGSLITLQITLLANVLGAFAFAPGLIFLTLGAFAVVLGSTQPLVLIGLATGSVSYLATCLCAVTGARRAHIAIGPRSLLSLPMYWLLQTPALWRALRELISAPYVWVKTDHGLSTKERRAPHDFNPNPGFDGREHGRVRRGRMEKRSAQQPAQAKNDPVDVRGLA